MKVLVTGSFGFIGKNLRERLSRIEGVEISTFDRCDDEASLTKKVTESDFIYHLAGINRPKDPKEFHKGNTTLTQKICDTLLQSGKKTPILLSSSTQAELDNDYGRSKKEAEHAVTSYADASGATAYIYRLPNVFGKWSRPNYNSVIATWCHNISRDLPIRIDDRSHELNLVYIDDVVDSFIRHLDENGASGVRYPEVSPLYKRSLGEIYELLREFKESRESLIIPRVGRGFERALYATYLSFIPKDSFSYELKGHRDSRGTFYEFLKTIDSGQVSISTTAPGVTRGNHYHNTKNEKFLVLKGKALIKLRDIYSDEVVEYIVDDTKMEVCEMIPGYTHDITNIADEEMILLIWSNEIYDPNNPDTYHLKV